MAHQGEVAVNEQPAVTETRRVTESAQSAQWGPVLSGRDEERRKVSVVIPAYNEAPVIGTVVAGAAGVLQAGGYDYEILVVDDGSQDGTAEAARQAGARVLQQPYNIGNGAAVKLGIRRASGDVIVLMDGDGQHQAEDIPRFLDYSRRYDLVVGARSKTSSRALHRIAANRLYSVLASYVVGNRVEDLTSGFRAIDAQIAKQIVYLLPNGFSYPSTMTIALFRSGYAVKYIPIRAAARIGRSKIKLLRDGLGFLLILARIGTFFAPMRLYLPLAVVTFLPGFVYALYRLAIGRPWTLPIVVSVMIGLLILVFGMISEQIALLRLGRSEHTAVFYEEAEGGTTIRRDHNPGSG